MLHYPWNALNNLRFFVLLQMDGIRFSCSAEIKSSPGLSLPSCCWLQVALPVLHPLLLLHPLLQGIYPGFAQLYNQMQQCSVTSWEKNVGPVPGTDGLVGPPEPPGKQRACTANLRHDCSWNSTIYSQQHLLLKYQDFVLKSSSMPSLPILHLSPQYLCHSSES